MPECFGPLGVCFGLLGALHREGTLQSRSPRHTNRRDVPAVTYRMGARLRWGDGPATFSKPGEGLGASSGPLRSIASTSRCLSTGQQKLHDCGSVLLGQGEGTPNKRLQLAGKEGGRGGAWGNSMVGGCSVLLLLRRLLRLRFLGGGLAGLAGGGWRPAILRRRTPRMRARAGAVAMGLQLQTRSGSLPLDARRSTSLRRGAASLARLLPWHSRPRTAPAATPWAGLHVSPST